VADRPTQPPGYQPFMATPPMLLGTGRVRLQDATDIQLADELVARYWDVTLTRPRWWRKMKDAEAKANRKAARRAR
jgi:hypothetical protein